MTTTAAALAIQAFASSAMCGVIWFVQVVHYPLFQRLRGDAARDYSDENRRRTPLVVIPLMLAEMATALLLAAYPPSGIDRSITIVGVAIIVAIWLSTAFVQMPLHERLTRDGQPGAAAALVHTNWFRTALWSVRAPLALWMLLHGH